MTTTSAGVSPTMAEFARQRVRSAVGTAAKVLGIDLLQGGVDQAVLLVTLSVEPRRLVLKLVGPQHAAGIDVRRTGAAMGLARAAGVPVAEVVAAGPAGSAGPWQFLLQEHRHGEQWRIVRPRLDASEVVLAHRALAETVLAIQSVRLSAFGELDHLGHPAGTGLLDSLRRRAELRIADARRRLLFCRLLDRDAAHFDEPVAPILSHDDLHHANVLFGHDHRGWRPTAVLDWDKAWAGPAESDVARMAFWDDMTGPGFWEVYREATPAADGAAHRALVLQLLWCLEYDEDSARHRTDRTALCRRLQLEPVLD